MSVSGSCACGAVRFTAEADPWAGTSRCNCTGCTKRGWWSVRTAREGLVVTAGEEHIVIDAPHPEMDRRRCGTCGLHLFSWVGPVEYGGPRWSINVRALDLPSWEGIPVLWLDGLHDTWGPLGTAPHHEPDIVVASRAVPRS